MNERRDFLKKIGLAGGAVGALFARKTVSQAEEIVNEAVTAVQPEAISSAINVAVSTPPTEQEVKKLAKTLSNVIREHDGRTLPRKVLRLANPHSTWCHEAGVEPGKIFWHYYGHTKVQKQYDSIIGYVRYKEWRGCKFNSTIRGTLPSVTTTNIESEEAQEIIRATAEAPEEFSAVYGPVFEIRPLGRDTVYEFWFNNKSLRAASMELPVDTEWSTSPYLFMPDRKSAGDGRFTFYTLAIYKEPFAGAAEYASKRIWELIPSSVIFHDMMCQRGDIVNQHRPLGFNCKKEGNRVILDDQVFQVEQHEVGEYYSSILIKDEDLARSWSDLKRTHVDLAIESIAKMITKDQCLGIVDQPTVNHLGVKSYCINGVRLLARYDSRSAGTRIDITVKAYGGNTPSTPPHEQLMKNAGTLDLSSLKVSEYQELQKLPFMRKLLSD